MKEERINGNVIEYYDSLDAPMVRFHLFNKYLMLDSIGGDVASLDRKLSAIDEMSARGDHANVRMSVMEIRQNLHFMMNNINPKSFAFAAMIHSINGVKKTDISELGLDRTIKELDEHGFSITMLTDAIDWIKKKLNPRLKGISRSSRMTVI